MKRHLIWGAVIVCGCTGLVSCAGDSGGVVNKVLVDFGIREKPEGYVSASDKVFQQLGDVAKTELKRLNQEVRAGEVKFQEQEGLRGKYYKQVKVYEDYRPIDVQSINRTASQEAGYVGVIEYTYRIFQSERMTSRAEAEAASASISTGETGKETFRYTFGPEGTWSGSKGERSRH